MTATVGLVLGRGHYMCNTNVSCVIPLDVEAEVQPKPVFRSFSVSVSWSFVCSFVEGTLRQETGIDHHAAGVSSVTASDSDANCRKTLDSLHQDRYM